MPAFDMFRLMRGKCRAAASGFYTYCIRGKQVPALFAVMVFRYKLPAHQGMSMNRYWAFHYHRYFAREGFY